MIVCVCNNISDREIRQAVDLGITSIAGLRKELGVGTMCGTCVTARPPLPNCAGRRSRPDGLQTAPCRRRFVACFR